MEGLAIANLTYHFMILAQEMLPSEPTKVAKSAFLADNLHRRAAISKRIAISQFRFKKVQQNEFLCIV